MKKTKILAFVLTVIMVFSTVSVSAFAAPTYNQIKDSVGESNVIYYDDFNGLTFTRPDSTAKTTNFSADEDYVNDKVNDTYLNSVVFQDYRGGKTAAGHNIFSEDGIVYKEWATDTQLTDDDNNCIDLKLKDTSAHQGKDMVLSTSFTMLSETFTGDFKYLVYSKYTTGSSKLKSTPFYLINGALKVNGQKVYDLQKGVTTDIAIHIRIVKPTAPDAEGDLTTLTGDAFTAKYGKVVFDTYIDGVMVAKDTSLLTEDQQKTITASKNGTATGLATDFRIEYFRLCNANGKITGADTNYNGESIIRQESIGLYLADSAALEAVNSANTVEGYDLTVKGGTLGLNYYLNLPATVLADENAKVVFTTPRGVQEVAIKGAEAETNGTYKFTANVSSVEMASDITMEIKSGETVYNIYKNGAKATEHTYTVKAYAEQLLSDATYGKIAKAMLNYGAYAQKYFDYDAQNLPVATPDVSKVTDNDISAVTIAGTAPQGTKAALVLDSDITIVIYNAEGEKIGEEKGITSLNLDKAYTIECEGGNVTVSVLAIGEKVLEKSANESYKDLIKALKLFADASKPFAAQ